MSDSRFEGINSCLNPITLRFSQPSLNVRYSEYKKEEDRIFFFRYSLFWIIFYLPVVVYIVTQLTVAISIVASSVTYFLILVQLIVNLLQIKVISDNRKIINILLIALIYFFCHGGPHGYLKLLNAKDALLITKLNYSKDTIPLVFFTVAFEFNVYKIILVNVIWVFNFVIRVTVRNHDYDPEFILLDIYFVVTTGILAQFYNYCVTRNDKLEYYKLVALESILVQIKRTYKESKNAVCIIRENRIAFSNDRFNKEFGNFYIEGKDKLTKKNVFEFMAKKLTQEEEIDFLSLANISNKLPINENFSKIVDKTITESSIEPKKPNDKTQVGESESLSATLGLQGKETEGPLKNKIRKFEDQLKEIKRNEKKKGEFEYLGRYKSSSEASYEAYFLAVAELGAEYLEFLFIKIDRITEELKIKNGLIESASNNTIKAVNQMKAATDNEFVYAPSSTSKIYRGNDLISYVLKIQSKELNNFSKKKSEEKFLEFEVLKILSKISLGCLRTTQEGANVNLLFFKKYSNQELSINDLDAFFVKYNKDTVKTFLLNLFKFVFASCNNKIPVLVNYSLVRFRNEDSNKFFSDGKKEYVNNFDDSSQGRKDFFLDMEVQYESVISYDLLGTPNFPEKYKEIENCLKLLNIYSSELKNNFSISQIRNESFISFNLKIENFVQVASTNSKPQQLNFKANKDKENRRNLDKLFKKPKMIPLDLSVELKPTRLQQVLAKNLLREDIAWIAIVDRNNGRRNRVAEYLDRLTKENGLENYKILDLADGSELLGCLYVQNIELKGKINIKLAFIESESDFVDGLSTIGVINKVCKDRRIQKIFTVCYLSSTEDKLDEIKVENLPDYAIEDAENQEEFEEAIKSYLGDN